MRKGKMVAQGSHASLGSFLDTQDHVAQDWLFNGQTKICVGVDSEKELVEIYEKAKAEGIPCVLIRDAGHTEFKEPTLTAVGIGPDQDSLIDPITGNLKLL